MAACVLGIDTSLRSTGFALVEARGSRLAVVDQGTIRNPARRPLSGCLSHLHTALAELIDRHGPAAAAIEGAFFARNIKTTLILGEARGAAIAACALRDVPVFEYAPRRVKQAVVGFGAADKEQVRRMVMTLLSLREEPQEDAGDALALAICHLHSHGRSPQLRGEPI